ncbi:MAG: rhodanese-like domain-containing protein [Candidatus Dormibacteraeota bacterium]|nr:rhodanese-like domain-containing protein [Candidatus Dormibacteraeota bacterium]
MGSVKDMVDAAKKRVAVVNREELEEELARGEAVVLDIRDVRERWKSGAIRGARHAPRGMLEFWADPESPYHKSFMDPGRRTIVHCAGGQRSALAAAALLDLGYRDVAHLEIGFDGWKESGGAVEEVSVPESYRSRA